MARSGGDAGLGARRTTTGTSASPPSATARMPRRASSTRSDRIVKIVNNYAAISFNFGPTLLSWLEQSDPETYAAIIDADRAQPRRASTATAPRSRRRTTT